MNELQPNQFSGSSYDKTLFLGYQKLRKLKIATSFSKEGNFFWSEDSPLR